MDFLLEIVSVLTLKLKICNLKVAFLGMTLKTRLQEGSHDSG